jgi:hypothetical protein
LLKAISQDCQDCQSWQYLSFGDGEFGCCIAASP